LLAFTGTSPSTSKPVCIPTCLKNTNGHATRNMLRPPQNFAEPASTASKPWWRLNDCTSRLTGLRLILDLNTSSIQPAMVEPGQDCPFLRVNPPECDTSYAEALGAKYMVAQVLYDTVRSASRVKYMACMLVSDVSLQTPSFGTSWITS